MSRLPWLNRMLRLARAPFASAASLLLLAALAMGYVGDLVHTDDGCRAEIHCLACQRVLVSVGVATVAAQFGPSAEVVGRVVVVARAATCEPCAPAAGSRAPPLA